MQKSPSTAKDISFEDFKTEVLNDYKLAVTSRECSLLGRREVLTGKAKFGIFGDGKEVPQLALAKAFKNGDFRSGYYRDQTFMMAIGALNIQQFFAGLYANTDLEKEPMSAGRQMGGHFATHSLNEDGSWNVKKVFDELEKRINEKTEAHEFLMKDVPQARNRMLEETSLILRSWCRVTILILLTWIPLLWFDTLLKPFVTNWCITRR